MLNLPSVYEMEELGFRDGTYNRKPNYPFIIGLFEDLEDAYGTGYLFGVLFNTYIFIIKKK